MFDRALLTVVFLGILPVQAAAQDWREVTSFRQRADESALEVHARYGAGVLSVAPGDPQELYRVSIRYDSDAFEPVTRYEAGELEVGVEGVGSGLRLNKNQSGEMGLWLSPDVPLDLDLDFGAVEARLDLGGLQLSRLSVETGASDTELAFASPNRARCERLEIAMGAASFEATGLANADCRVINMEGGVGDMTLDFSGEWRRDLTADLTMALGSVTLRIPSDIGVRVEQETFLADFSGSRFDRRDGIRYSDNWETAERRLTIRVEGAFGSIDVRWIQPELATP